MKKSEELKQIVREKYSEIAEQSKELNESTCCGAESCCSVDYTVFSEDYSKLKGYNEEADLGLGCGLPTEFAQIKEGDTVLDLGSGAGNDCFVAREIVGEKGKVIGVDMTMAMIDKARENTDRRGFNNVEFRFGDIEDLPLGKDTIDVVVSNCVLNLVPDKEKAFSETFAVLKPGGHFSVSDVVIKGKLPDPLKDAAEMYAGCVSGAIEEDDYMAIIEKTGFKDISIQKRKKVELPDELLNKYLSPKELAAYSSSGFGIYSITVYAIKPKFEAFSL